MATLLTILNPTLPVFWLAWGQVWGFLPWLPATGLATPAAASVSPSTSSPALPSLLQYPPGFFHLPYCGSGRPTDPESGLRRLDWDLVARSYELTILQGTEHDYLRFIRSLMQRQPNHRVIFYVHSHGVHSYDDRTGVLNLDESNFLHGTDPASLRVLPTREGLLIDWKTDERDRYDEYGAISEAREFAVRGYVIYRAEGDGELAPLWSSGLPSGGTLPTEYVDRTINPGMRYRYTVRTIGPLDQEFGFSGEVEAVAPATGDASPQPLLVHGLETVIEAVPDSSSYGARFRIRTSSPISRAIVRIDRNADGDFAGPGETVAMNPAGDGGWLEASTRLRPSDHTNLGLRVTYGFAYRLEIDTPSGQIVLPDRGAYTTSINNRVKDTRYGFNLTRMSAEHWQEFVLRTLQTRARAGGMVRGVFLDELVFDPAIGVDAATIELVTKEQQTRDAQALIDAIRHERPDLAIYYNGLGTNIAPTGTTGGMIEGFAVGPWHRAPGGAPSIAAPEEWEKLIGWAISAREEELLLLARGPALTDTRARLFAFGSYLLVRRPGMRFGYMADRCRQPPLPEWGVDLGEPVSGVVPQRSERVRYQGFKNGAVWVNAEVKQSVPVKISQPAFRLGIDTRTGDEVGKVVWERVQGEVEIEPQSAAIFVYASTVEGSGPRSE